MGDPIQIREVVQRVECEIYDTVLQYEHNARTPWILDYAAKVNLELTVSADGSVSPDFALLGPFNPIGLGGGTYSLGIGGSLKGTAERVAVYAFSIKFADAKERFAKACSNPENSRLHGSIGFHDWFSRVVASFDDDDPFKRPSDLTHKLDFQIDAGLKITPAYELLRSKASLGLAGNWTWKHSVDFTMTYNDPTAPDYQKVCVVNAAAPCPGQAKVVERKTKTGRRYLVRPSLSPEVRQRLDNNLIDLQLRSLRLDQLKR